MSLLLLTLLVVRPSFARHRDVAVLTLLCSAAQHNHERVTVLAELMRVLPRSLKGWLLFGLIAVLGLILLGSLQDDTMRARLRLANASARTATSSNTL